MADDKQKIYVGTGKQIQTQYGGILKYSFTEEDLKTMQQHLDRGWVNLAFFERREPSAKGMTHYAVIDTWKPEQREEQVPPSLQGAAADTAPTPAPLETEPELSPEDLPF